MDLLLESLIQKRVDNLNIPHWLEEAVKDRDKKCVYCGIEFG